MEIPNDGKWHPVDDGIEGHHVAVGPAWRRERVGPSVRLYFDANNFPMEHWFFTPQMLRDVATWGEQAE